MPIVDPALTGAPPSAYPHPITLPVSPQGDPEAATLLAAAYRGLADRLDARDRAVSGLLVDLQQRWHGAGAGTTTTAASTLHDNLGCIAATCRQAAEQLEEYAGQLRHAQHHHGWSLGRLLAVGAVVAVTAVAITVTVGAAAPVGTVAAIEVGEALAGVEGAAATAEAATTAATDALAGVSRALAAVRPLSAVLAPHLVQAVTAAGIQTVTDLVTGHPVRVTDVVETAGTAFATTAAAGAATTAAVRATSELPAVTATAARILAGQAAATGVQGGEQYATSGDIDVRDLLIDAGTGLALDTVGSARGLRTGVTHAVPPGASGGQDAEDLIRNGVDLDLHEGGTHGGHTLRKHVARSKRYLRWRIKNEGLPMASTFSTRAEAERAATQAFREYPRAMRRLRTRPGHVSRLLVTSPVPYGYALLPDGTTVACHTALVCVTYNDGKYRVITEFVEP